MTGDDGQEGPRGSQAFVIRLQGTSGDLRGQVVAVSTGASRLFKDLPEAMAFIEEIVEAERRGNPTGGSRRPGQPGRRPADR